MPNKGDEFHHFGWNACSSALSPLTGHAFLERRYLIIPGIRSSRIYVVDTKPHPTQAKIHKIIEPEEVFRKTGYSRPHTMHCGPEGIYVSTLGGGGKDGTDGPPGIFIMDCETFEVLGRWEIDRGPQTLHYDFWWNLPRDYMVIERVGAAAAVRERHRAGGPALATSMATGCISGTCARAATCRPSTSAPTTRWRWRCGLRTIPCANTASSASWSTPPTSKARSGPGGAKAASSTSRRPRRSRPSRRRRSSCRRCCRASARCRRWSPTSTCRWTTSFSTSPAGAPARCASTMSRDPRKPKLAGSVHIGGIARRTPHPNGKAFAGGPQMVEISRDGKRVYWTNSLYSTWDDQFYPDGVPAAQVMADREAGRRPRAGEGLLGELPRRLPGAPDPARRRRLLDRFVLLSVGLNLSGADWTPAGLWLAVVASGVYHGVNPAMGWPLAVSAGLMERASAGAVRGARAAGRRPSAGDAAGDAAVRAADHAGRMAAPDPDRRQPARHRVRHLPACQPKPSTGAGADPADATGAVVVCRRHRAWRGTDAGADLSRALPGKPISTGAMRRPAASSTPTSAWRCWSPSSMPPR